MDIIQVCSGWRLFHELHRYRQWCVGAVGAVKHPVTIQLWGGGKHTDRFRMLARLLIHRWLPKEVYQKYQWFRFYFGSVFYFPVKFPALRDYSHLCLTGSPPWLCKLRYPFPLCLLCQSSICSLCWFRKLLLVLLLLSVVPEIFWIPLLGLNWLPV